MTDPKRTELIRERAHRLWEEDGHPEGREADHWARAEAEIDAEDQAPKDDPQVHSDPDTDHPAPTTDETSATAGGKQPRKRAAR